MKKDSIYIVKCIGSEETFIKLGFTSKSIKVRFKELPYKYKILRVVNVKNAKFHERTIHRFLSKKRYKPSIKFNGYTECYEMSCFNEINKLINELCNIKRRSKNKIKDNFNYSEYRHQNKQCKLDYIDVSMFKK